MIGRKSLLVFLSRTTGRFLEGILYLIAVDRFLPIYFGYQQVALSLIGFFTFFATLGLNFPHLKIMAELENRELHDAFTTFFFVRVFLLIISIFLTIVIFFIQISLDKIENNSEMKWIFFILLIQYILVAFRSIYELSYQARMNIAKIEIPWMIGDIARFIFSLIAILIFHNFLLYLTGSVIAEIIRSFFLLFYYKAFKFTKFQVDLFKRYFLMNLFFVISILINTLTRNLGPFIFLRYFNEELLGVFNVISMFFLLITNLEETFRSLIVPNFTVLLKNKDLPSLQRFVGLFERYLLIINAVGIMGGILFARHILLRVLGPAYFENGMMFFYGSLLSMLIFPLFGSYSHLLIAADKLKMYTLLSFIGFIFSFISWIFLIPIIDITGIQLGNWLSAIPTIILIKIYCQKNFQVGKVDKPQFLNLIAILLLILISFIFASFKLTFWVYIIIFLVFSLLYVLFLFISKNLNKEDLHYLWDLINPKKMVDYMKLESQTKDLVNP